MIALVTLLSSGIVAQPNVSVKQGDQMGEFSSIGQLFSLGRGLKITEAAQKFWLLFSTVAFMH
jgi:hypothetical protein